MKKIFLFLFAFSGALLTAFSQNIGIGTPNPLNKLHVAGGFRLDTLANGIDSGVLRHDKNGVVYSLKFTGNATHVLRGDGTFGPGSSGSGAAWLISGNSGIDSATQFLGTTDARPLLFRVNNQRAGLIDPNPNHFNTAFGLNALSSNTPDLFTDHHGSQIWRGIGNTANGYNALSSNVSGNWNTANGVEALSTNNGSANTANGFRALFSNTTGFSNTANGILALYSNTTGYSNAANGSEALYSNTTGNHNSAHGHRALYSNTTGEFNTANGSSALFFNTTGMRNTANGFSALVVNSTGNDNTANGYQALFSNTTGNSNTANGKGALRSNTIGINNTANGNNALFSNTTAVSNTANGNSALYSNTTGNSNTADGDEALLSNSTGDANTAIGSEALKGNTTGVANTAVGNHALAGNVGSNSNTAIGFFAGGFYQNGWNNTFIGAHADVNGADYYNCIALGNLTTCTAPNQMRVGNTSTSSIGGQVGWTTLSDERMKTNVQENVKGLDFIKMLRPVTYNLDANKLSGWLKEDKRSNEKKNGPNPLANDLMRKSLNEKSKMVFSGFLAQDVEMAAKKLGYNFSGVDAPKNENDLYGLRYSDFVVPLVKAVQEQQQQIEELKNEINELKKLILTK